MVNLILHPGHSKCGSTTIQDFIYANRKEFLNRGIFLPDINFNFSGLTKYKFHLTQTPRSYFSKIQNDKIPLSDLENRLDELINKAKKLGCTRVLISAENLINGIESNKTASIHRLFNMKFTSVDLIYYVRKQTDLLVSAWQQWGHKNGEPLDDYIVRMSKTNFVDFLTIANNFQKFYPNQNVDVFPLNHKFLKHNDLIKDFCSRAKIDVEGLNLEVMSSNSSLSSALCRTIEKIYGVYSNSHDQNVKNSIIKLTPYSERLRTKKYSNDISSSSLALLINKFQNRNKKLREIYFPEISFEDTISLTETSKNIEILEDAKNEDNLSDRVERLEDIIAIQMDMILQLNSKLENHK